MKLPLHQRLSALCRPAALPVHKQAVCRPGALRFGLLNRLRAAGRGSRSESVLRWTDTAAGKAAKISRLRAV
ncbi:hypothetical protein HMPREF1986_02161 [Oribacterium sp. oral taxon 078 str. F0263]|nr:hypothetical protein HMPREF1986_02161 [Oribacterium sp. oral taxon 078 str. F0263]